MMAQTAMEGTSQEDLESIALVRLVLQWTLSSWRLL
jgi:hypothetical protein